MASRLARPANPRAAIGEFRLAQECVEEFRRRASSDGAPAADRTPRNVTSGAVEFDANQEPAQEAYGENHARKDCGMTLGDMPSAPRIVICIKGGLVQDVLSDTPGIGVEVMDWDILEDGDMEHVKDYIDNRLDLLTPASREAAATGEYGDLQVDTAKFPHALY